jgi:hypothetical protein
VAVALRFYVRAKLLRVVKAEDWFILAALVSSCCLPTAVSPRNKPKSSPVFRHSPLSTEVLSSSVSLADCVSTQSLMLTAASRISDGPRAPCADGLTF